MTHHDFKAHLKALGLTHERAGEFLGYHRVTVSKWANGTDPVPRVVALLLRLMVSRGIAPGEVSAG